eukprot:387173-Ditylum_brightwellii.AAC.1
MSVDITYQKCARQSFPASPTNCDLLKQYGLISLEVMKRNAHCYFSDDAMTDNVPALDAMNTADITPSTDN